MENYFYDVIIFGMYKILYLKMFCFSCLAVSRNWGVLLMKNQNNSINLVHQLYLSYQAVLIAVDWFKRAMKNDFNVGAVTRVALYSFVGLTVQWRFDVPLYEWIILFFDPNNLYK